MSEPNRPPRPAMPATSAPRPDDPSAHADELTGRAAVLAAQGRFREAIEAFRRVVEWLPDSAIARANLAITLARAGALEADESLLADAIEQGTRAIRLQPGTLVLHHQLAAILAIADRPAEALAVLDAAIPIDPGHVRTRALRSQALLTLGDFEAGWPDFDARLDILTGTARELPGLRRWRGEPLAGPLLIDGLVEGNGDTFQGIRFAAEARQRVGSTILACPPSMARLMGRCAGIDRIVASRDGIAGVEAQVVPLSLASACRATGATMWNGPYLSTDPAVVARWRPTLESIPGRKVGCAWQGNPEYRTDAWRSFRLDDLEPLSRVPGITLISLQKGSGSDQLAGLAARFPVFDLGPTYASGDWMETAAILAGLDLVIAPDTAIAHLAGALGKPVWIAPGTPADWRWGTAGETTPWYPTARLFRQHRRGDWAEVFARMADSLAGWIAG